MLTDGTISPEYPVEEQVAPPAQLNARSSLWITLLCVLLASAVFGLLGYYWGTQQTSQDALYCASPESVTIPPVEEGVVGVTPISTPDTSGQIDTSGWLSQRFETPFSDVENSSFRSFTLKYPASWQLQDESSAENFSVKPTLTSPTGEKIGFFQGEFGWGSCVYDGPALGDGMALRYYQYNDVMNFSTGTTWRISGDMGYVMPGSDQVVRELIGRQEVCTQSTTGNGWLGITPAGAITITPPTPSATLSVSEEAKAILQNIEIQ